MAPDLALDDFKVKLSLNLLGAVSYLALFSSKNGCFNCLCMQGV